jgi:hypothetical protein
MICGNIILPQMNGHGFLEQGKHFYHSIMKKKEYHTQTILLDQEWEVVYGKISIIDYGFGVGMLPKAKTGVVYCNNVHKDIGAYSQLWRFENGMWTFVSGSEIMNDPGVYSDPKTPDPSAYPPARFHAACWTDQAGNFWLYGGMRDTGL